MDCSLPGFSAPGILQARTLEWVAISFSNAWKWKVKVKSLSRVQPSATSWTAAYQAPPSMGFSRQQYWSGVPLPSPDYAQQILDVSDSLTSDICLSCLVKLLCFGSLSCVLKAGRCLQTESLHDHRNHLLCLLLLWITILYGVLSNIWIYFSYILSSFLGLFFWGGWGPIGFCLFSVLCFVCFYGRNASLVSVTRSCPKVQLLVSFETCIFVYMYRHQENPNCLKAGCNISYLFTVLECQDL